MSSPDYREKCNFPNPAYRNCAGWPICAIWSWRKWVRVWVRSDGARIWYVWNPYVPDVRRICANTIREDSVGHHHGGLGCGMISDRLATEMDCSSKNKSMNRKNVVSYWVLATLKWENSRQNICLTPRWGWETISTFLHFHSANLCQRQSDSREEKTILDLSSKVCWIKYQDRKGCQGDREWHAHAGNHGNVWNSAK